MFIKLSSLVHLRTGNPLLLVGYFVIHLASNKLAHSKKKTKMICLFFNKYFSGLSLYRALLDITHQSLFNKCLFGGVAILGLLKNHI